MAGKGPIPARSTERTRRNKTGEDGIELKKGTALEYKWTPPGEDWPDFIARYYSSFQKSGMQAYFQQTDIEQLWLSCQMMADQFKTGRPSAMMIGEALKLLEGLGATEGERRRMKIELEVEREDDSAEEDAKMAAVTSITDRLAKSADGA